ncbi:hypothetical protein HBN82_22360 [Pseudomonas lundensis]|uniref:hypothetical protein n=1 Tax=Pseudomonas lundensis TaxID=86185 RepID=UPI0014749B45|nr:hypothetical protein [Pseudomonas lundensis]NNA18592.1 hypothetical protein [Pseudomonas lundensis]
MRMKAHHLAYLEKLMKRTDLSPRSTLILARRLARQIGLARESWTERSSSDRGQAKDSDFRQKPEKNKKIAAEKSQQLLDSLRNIGERILEDDKFLTKKYGFEGLCDILQVNRVHRLEVRERVKHSERLIATLVFVWAFEDSATVLSGRRATELKGGPLYHALMQTLKRAYTREAK